MLIREKKFSWKASCKTITKWLFCNPLKTYQSLVEKLIGPMSFDIKIVSRNYIKNIPNVLEAKLRLLSWFSIKVYVENTPPDNCLMMMGHLYNIFVLVVPKQYLAYAWNILDHSEAYIFLTHGIYQKFIPCYVWNCHKPPRYVPYKCTYVPYDGTFGTSEQGQTLDVWQSEDSQIHHLIRQIHRFTISSVRKKLNQKRYRRIRISTTILDHTDRN